MELEMLGLGRVVLRITAIACGRVRIGVGVDGLVGHGVGPLCRRHGADRKERQGWARSEKTGNARCFVRPREVKREKESQPGKAKRDGRSGCGGMDLRSGCQSDSEDVDLESAGGSITTRCVRPCDRRRGRGRNEHGSGRGRDGGRRERETGERSAETTMVEACSARNTTRQTTTPWERQCACRICRGSLFGGVFAPLPSSQSIRALVPSTSTPPVFPASFPQSLQSSPARPRCTRQRRRSRHHQWTRREHGQAAHSSCDAGAVSNHSPPNMRLRPALLSATNSSLVAQADQPLVQLLGPWLYSTDSSN